MNRLRNQKGFTLIELIVILVILGILSAWAVPKYLDIRADARDAVAHGVTGALRGAIATLHAKYLINNTDYGASTVVAAVVSDITLTANEAGTEISATISETAYKWTYTARSGETPGKVAETSGWS